MAYREARRAGKPGPEGQLAQHIGARVLRVLFLASREVAEGDAAYLAEHAGQRKMSPHPIQPVRALADVLEEEDRALERRQKRSAQKAGEHRQVAAEERPLRRA